MLLSDDIRDLAPCTEALRMLVHPFELPHVYIPYLPRMLGDTCRAPVSFLMGMLLDDYMSVELDEAVSFATVYLGHDRFVPPMVRTCPSDQVHEQPQPFFFGENHEASFSSAGSQCDGGKLFDGSRVFCFSTDDGWSYCLCRCVRW